MMIGQIQNFWSLVPNFSAGNAPGLVAWWDTSLPQVTVDTNGSNTIDTAVSNTFSRLYDKSNNSNHAVQAVKLNQPATGTQNGLNAWLDNSSLGKMTFPLIGGLGASDLSIYAATFNKTVGSNYHLGIINVGSAFVSGFLIERLTGATVGMRYDNNGNDLYGTVGSPPTNSDTTSVFSFIKSLGNSVNLYDKGVNLFSDTTAAYNASFTDATGKLGIDSGANSWIGGILEVLVCKAAHSDTIRNSMESYLKNKWGL